MDVPTTTTAEDRAWFAEEVTVQVEQDNRAWLDTLLEMKRAELENFAIYNYGLPEAAVQAVGRNDLISMVAVANKAGGGQAVSRQQYLYVPELKGIIEPAVSLFKADDDPLYLVRGEGSGAQVYDKVNDQWLNLEKLRKQHAQNVQNTRTAAADAAASVAGHPQFSQTAPVEPAAPAKPTLSDAVVSILPTLKRADMIKFGEELGMNAEELNNQEIYPSNKALADKILGVNEANKKG